MRCALKLVNLIVCWKEVIDVKSTMSCGKLYRQLQSKHAIDALTAKRVPNGDLEDVTVDL